jgi:hypothetical protein
MKTLKKIKSLWLITLIALATTLNSQAERVSTINQVVDTGSHFVANKGSGVSGTAYIDYSGDLSYCTPTWDITAGSFWPRCGKGKVSGASGYPKLADSISGSKYLKYNATWKSGSGTRQLGAYIWLGRNANPVWTNGDWTHEINIWNWTTNNNQTRGESVGTYSADGGSYNVRKYSQTTSGQTFTAWTVVRTSDKASMNLDIKALLNWLRARGLPNHYVIEITPAAEGLTTSGRSTGKVEMTSIQVPNL